MSLSSVSASHHLLSHSNVPNNNMLALGPWTKYIKWYDGFTSRLIKLRQLMASCHRRGNFMIITLAWLELGLDGSITGEQRLENIPVLTRGDNLSCPLSLSSTVYSPGPGSTVTRSPAPTTPTPSPSSPSPSAPSTNTHTINQGQAFPGDFYILAINIS